MEVELSSGKKVKAEEVILSNGRKMTVREIKFKEVAGKITKNKDESFSTMIRVSTGTKVGEFGMTEEEFDDLNLIDGVKLAEVFTRINGFEMPEDFPTSKGNETFG